jgi:hypothetical protein
VAVGTVQLPPMAARMPDGSASNLACGSTTRQGTQTGLKNHFTTLDFDGAGGLENALWHFRMPSDYASGGALKIQWQANSTSAQNCKWQAQVGAVTPADADTVLEHAFAAAATVTTANNTAEARRLIESSITLTMDSAAAGDFITIRLFRDSADAADTLAVDAEVLMVVFEYTTT